MLFAVHHQPYSIMILFIEPRGGEGIVVRLRTTFLLPLFVSFFDEHFCFGVRCLLYIVYITLVLSLPIVVERDNHLGLFRGYSIVAALPRHPTQTTTMPPRRATAWVSHSTLLSDRIRPSSGSTQPAKSDKGKGKGKAKATTPEPPPRSAAVRRLDEILGGFYSTPTSNQPPRNETKRTTAVPGAASADSEGCFCQGTSPRSFVSRFHYCDSYQPRPTTYQNTRPSARRAVSSSAPCNCPTAPAHTAQRHSSHRPHGLRSSRSWRSCGRIR